MVRGARGIKGMFTVDGLRETPYRPVPGRVHPNEGSFLVRTQGKNEGGEKIVVHIKKRKGTVCGLRDTMAKAGSSAKRSQLVNANGHIDRRLDAPSVCLTPPRPRRRRK